MCKSLLYTSVNKGNHKGKELLVGLGVGNKNFVQVKIALPVIVGVTYGSVAMAAC